MGGKRIKTYVQLKLRGEDLPSGLRRRVHHVCKAGTTEPPGEPKVLSLCRDKIAKEVQKRACLYCIVAPEAE